MNVSATFFEQNKSSFLYVLEKKISVETIFAFIQFSDYTSLPGREKSLGPVGEHNISDWLQHTVCEYMNYELKHDIFR